MKIRLNDVETLRLVNFMSKFNTCNGCELHLTTEATGIGTTLKVLLKYPVDSDGVTRTREEDITDYTSW